MEGISARTLHDGKRSFGLDFKPPKLLDQARDVMRCHTEKLNSPPLEISRLLVRFDHVARFIVNANHSIV